MPHLTNYSIAAIAEVSEQKISECLYSISLFLVRTGSVAKRKLKYFLRLQMIKFKYFILKRKVKFESFYILRMTMVKIFIRKCELEVIKTLLTLLSQLRYCFTIGKKVLFDIQFHMITIFLLFCCLVITKFVKFDINAKSALNLVAHSNISDSKNFNYSNNFNAIGGGELPNSLENATDTNLPIYVMVHAKENTTFSSELTATIESIPLKEGDSFKEGDILIKFDCRVAEAELEKANAQKKMAESSYESAKKLQYYQTIGVSELIKAEAEAEIARADIKKLSAIVDKCVIEAPYDGAVSESIAHKGESVKPGDPLLKVVNIEDLELQMQVPSNWLQWLHIGTLFKVNINELNKSISAKVSKINPEINSVSQTVKIIGVLTENVPGILPGMSGQATFNVPPSTSTDNKTDTDNKIGG